MRNEEQKSKNKHHGKVTELIIRRSGLSITEVATKTGVNRRSVYNWFTQEKLSPKVISLLSSSLQYDFFQHFPEMEVNHYPLLQNHAKTDQASIGVPERTDEWKNRYIHLLEKYTELLHTATMKVGQY